MCKNWQEQLYNLHDCGHMSALCDLGLCHAVKSRVFINAHGYGYPLVVMVTADPHHMPQEHVPFKSDSTALSTLGYGHAPTQITFLFILLVTFRIVSLLL